MATQAEETQAKEFLKRAEIRTMKKDLLSLREVDALKERDKIAHIKTLEEQQAEQQKKIQEKESLEKSKREDILQKNEGQERIAEKDLKNYASEQERQQIFLLESERLELAKSVFGMHHQRTATPFGDCQLRIPGERPGKTVVAGDGMYLGTGPVQGIQKPVERGPCPVVRARRSQVAQQEHLPGFQAHHIGI